MERLSFELFPNRYLHVAYYTNLTNADQLCRDLRAQKLGQVGLIKYYHIFGIIYSEYQNVFSMFLNTILIMDRFIRNIRMYLVCY